MPRKSYAQISNMILHRFVIAFSFTSSDFTAFNIWNNPSIPSPFIPDLLQVGAVPNSLPLPQTFLVSGPRQILPIKKSSAASFVGPWPEHKPPERWNRPQVPTNGAPFSSSICFGLFPTKKLCLVCTFTWVMSRILQKFTACHINSIKVISASKHY